MCARLLPVHDSVWVHLVRAHEAVLGPHVALKGNDLGAPQRRKSERREKKENKEECKNKRARIPKKLPTRARDWQ